MYLANTTGALNYPLLRAWGAGQFVGCCFSTDFSETPFPRSLWESDEAVFVDDDPQLTLWGTGNEDFVNDAWGFHQTQTEMAGGAWLDNHMWGYRFHVPDRIPFQKKIAYTLEHGSSNNCSAQYQSVAYYYLQRDPNNLFFEGQSGPRQPDKYWKL